MGTWAFGRHDGDASSSGARTRMPMTAGARDASSRGSIKPFGARFLDSVISAGAQSARKGARAALVASNVGNGAREREERRPRERVHVSFLLQRSNDDVVAPRSTAPACPLACATRCDRGPKPVGPIPCEPCECSAGDATSGSSARWQSREAMSEGGAGAREGVAGFSRGRIDRRRPGSPKVLSFHEDRAESGLGRTGPRQRAARTPGENGEATGASEAGRSCSAIGEDNAPSPARTDRRSVLRAVKRETPRGHGFLPDDRGSRAGRGYPSPNVSMASIGRTHLWLKAHRRSRGRRQVDSLALEQPTRAVDAAHAGNLGRTGARCSRVGSLLCTGVG